MIADIKQIKFELLTSKTHIESFNNYYNIHWKWFGPQLLAALASYDVILDADGFVNVRATLNELDARGRGMLIVCSVSRSDVGTGKHVWTSKDLSPYCGLVPLFLAAHKRHNGIPYEKWSKASNLADFMPTTLATAMASKADYPDRETAMALRRYYGTKYSAVVTAPGSAWNISESPNGWGNEEKCPTLNAPKLTKIMHMQLWCANVLHRNELMVLDNTNWDRMPDAFDGGSLLEDADSNRPLGPDYWGPASEARVQEKPTARAPWDAPVWSPEISRKITKVNSGPKGELKGDIPWN